MSFSSLLPQLKVIIPHPLWHNFKPQPAEHSGWKMRLTFLRNRLSSLSRPSYSGISSLWPSVHHTRIEKQLQQQETQVSKARELRGDIESEAQWSAHKAWECGSVLWPGTLQLFMRQTRTLLKLPLCASFIKASCAKPFFTAASRSCCRASWTMHHYIAAPEPLG